jgi:hypothetical protein
MTTTTAGMPDAEAAARVRVADILSILAEDRAAFHEGVLSASSGRPAPDSPPPAPLPVNAHPGPDFYPRAAA